MGVTFLWSNLLSDRLLHLLPHELSGLNLLFPCLGKLVFEEIPHGRGRSGCLAECLVPCDVGGVGLV